MHARVQRRELADETADQVRQLGPRRHPVHQRQVLRERAFPVDAVHVGVVEIVALHAPSVDHHLAPVLADVHAEGPRVEVDLAVVELVPSRRGAGVENEEIVTAPHKKLLAVERQLRLPNTFHDSNRVRVVAVERERHQIHRGARAGAGAGQIEERMLVRLQAGVVARLDGNLARAPLEAVEVDLDGLVGGRVFCVLSLRLFLRVLRAIAFGRRAAR